MLYIFVKFICLIREPRNRWFSIFKIKIYYIRIKDSFILTFPWVQHLCSETTRRNKSSILVYRILLLPNGTEWLNTAFKQKSKPIYWRKISQHPSSDSRRRNNKLKRITGFNYVPYFRFYEFSFFVRNDKSFVVLTSASHYNNTQLG